MTRSLGWEENADCWLLVDGEEGVVMRMSDIMEAKYLKKMCVKWLMYLTFETLFVEVLDIRNSGFI